MKHSEAPSNIFAPGIRERLEAYAALLTRWNARINLISRGDASDLWTRHILDSAQLGNLLPAATGTLADFGSGAGFPGLILAITTGWKVHLVESDQRKAAFLREAVRATGALAEVHPVRVEALSLARVAVVTARALAPLPDLLTLAYPRLTPGGICLFPKGVTANDELTAAENEWHMRVERFPSQTSPGATLLRISELRRVASDS